MDTESYDQQNVAPTALGDAADYLVEQAVAHHRVLQRRDRHRRDPGVGRADASPTPSPASRATGSAALASRPRSRPARSLQVPLFINIGDRVQGRHPLRRLHHQGLRLAERGARRRRGAAGRRRALAMPANAPLILLYEADTKVVPVRDAVDGAGRRTRSRSRRLLVARRRGPSRTDRRRDRRARQGLDAGADAADRSHGHAHRRRSSCSAAPTCRSRWCSTRRSSWPSGSRPTTPGASSTACCRRWLPSCARDARGRPG